MLSTFWRFSPFPYLLLCFGLHCISFAPLSLIDWTVNCLQPTTVIPILTHQVTTKGAAAPPSEETNDRQQYNVVLCVPCAVYISLHYCVGSSSSFSHKILGGRMSVCMLPLVFSSISDAFAVGRCIWSVFVLSGVTFRSNYSVYYVSLSAIEWILMWTRSLIEFVSWETKKKDRKVAIVSINIEVGGDQRGSKKARVLLRWR